MTVTRNENGLLTSYHGISIKIEVQMGRYRTKAGKQSILMAADYGEMTETTGADGKAIDCYVGVFPECLNVYIINQRQFETNHFDEHKVMLGFLSQEEAIKAYQLSTYNQQPLSVISCTASQLRWWLKFGHTQEPVTAQSFPFDPESDLAMQQNIFDWNNIDLATSQAIYQMCKTDDDQQLLEGATFDSIVEEILHKENGEFFIFDALVIEKAKLERTAQILGRTFNRFGASKLKVAENGIQISEPFKRSGTTNIAMIFELSDGQTVTCFLHNPDKTPTKLLETDNLVAWRWLLNKKDITILVAPEEGKDQEITQIAQRIMAFAEKNSSRFIQANARRQQRIADIQTTESRIEAKQQQLQELVDQIEAIKNKSADLPPQDTPITESAPVPSANPDPIPEPVSESEPEPEPEPATQQTNEPETNITDIPQRSSDKAFLERIIQGQENVLDHDTFFPKLEEVAIRYDGIDDEEMTNLVLQAVIFYQNELDAAVAKAPTVPDNPESQKRYVQAISNFKDNLEACRSTKEVEEYMIDLVSNMLSSQCQCQYYFTKTKRFTA